MFSKDDQCYNCRKSLKEKHNHYKWMCESCGELNLHKRTELADLDGYYALVTGARIKIGFETALKLLRSGAYVIVTTRFPVDAAIRYTKQEDFLSWKDRLKIFKIDFRNIGQVESFALFLEGKLPHLDILINNAAQTIRRPYEYYDYLQDLEDKEYIDLESEIKNLIYKENYEMSFPKLQQYLDIKEARNRTLSDSNNLLKNSENNEDSLFSNNPLDEYGLPIDKRKTNSWILKAENVSIVEMLEVQLVNVTAPFILNTRLKELMKNSPNKNKYIINVSAMEGKFNKKNKNAFHPHTNMAKAALNMMTRTSAQDYRKSNIFMNSVDTGWVTDENPYHIETRNVDNGRTPPLDSLDGAARVCDPIFYGLKTGKNSFGRFFKNYKPTDW